MIATRTLIFAGVAALIPALAIAQVNSTNQGYLVNDPDFNVVTAVSGTVCVRTSDWTPARATAAKACQQCTPDLCVKPVAVAQTAPTPLRRLRRRPKRRRPSQRRQKCCRRKSISRRMRCSTSTRRCSSPKARRCSTISCATLQGAQYEVIVTTGHTDRFGSDAIQPEAVRAPREWR